MDTNDTPRLSALMGELKESKTMRERWAKLEAFQAMLNQPPPDAALEATPDGQARTMVISHVENALDMFFLGQWSTRDFAFKVVGNELAGQITLEVINPITDKVRTLSGVAAQAIMMDKAPDELRGQEKNRWSQDINNKKSKALKMNLPALKSECLKNAAAQLGKAFGKDLNRKNVATYSAKMGKTTRLPKTFMDGAKAEISAKKTTLDKVVEHLENNGIQISEEQLVELSQASPNYIHA
jgi:hypothetical protein